MQQEEDFFQCDVQDISDPAIFKNKNNNNINKVNETLEEIVQIWKDVCECEESKFYKEKIDYFLKTIEVLKSDIGDVKLQNKKLVEENCEIKNELKDLNEKLMEIQLEKHNEQKRIVEGDDGASACEDSRLQGSVTSTADNVWLLSTEQWLENVTDDMNPSTDADNFEKMNAIKGEMSGISNDSERKVDCDGEEVVQRFQSTAYFEDYDEDEVFEDLEETESSVAYPRNTTSRIRRISDVIDSIGDICHSPANKDECTSFSYELTSFRHNEFQLQTPPQGRKIPTMTDSPCSPPMTPGSDLGYGSTGMPTPPSNAVYRSKSFRFSASSVEIAPPQWDTQLDAKPIEKEDQSSLSNCTSWTKPEATMASQKDSRAYNMNHKRRGRAIIFNHEEFRDMPARKGSGVDVKRLNTALTTLGFSVQIYNDLEIEKLKTKIDELSSEDHSDADCIVVTVLTHGLSTGCLMAKDYAYPTEHLWTPFTADKCPSLAGKPKIFFIQACRGEKLDGGVTLVRRTETDTGSLSYKIPTMADFLLAFSTFEGFYSWRHPETGTWFVQCLCQVLEEEGQKSSLHDILVEVSRRVAIDFESYNDLYPWQHEQKQVPQINSTLLRQVYFSPKD